MRHSIKLLIIPLCLIACDAVAPVSREEPAEEQMTARDTTPRVTGIGGIFFYAEDPAAIMEWYGSNLGMAMDPFTRSIFAVQDKVIQGQRDSAGTFQVAYSKPL